MRRTVGRADDKTVSDSGKVDMAILIYAALQPETLM